MRMIFVFLLTVVLAYFAGVVMAKADVMCDMHGAVEHFKEITTGPQRCSGQTFKEMLKIGNDIAVCEQLLRSLDKLNYINGVYKPKTFNEILALDDMDDAPTFADYLVAIKDWRKRECGAYPKAQRSPNVRD